MLFERFLRKKTLMAALALTAADYTLINVPADPTQMAELDRVLRINDAVKRHMIVRRVDKD